MIYANFDFVSQKSLVSVDVITRMHCTDMYRPLNEWPTPIIDLDTDPYRFRLSTKFTDMPTLLTQCL